MLLSDNVSGVLLITVGMGRSFHQPGKVNENVLESDFRSQASGGDIDS